MVVLAACATPTQDADQTTRLLISSQAWISDPAYAASDPTVGFVVYFNANGVATQSGSYQGTWSYKSSTFTFTDSQGSTWVTSSPSLASDHFYFIYNGGLCHFKPAS